ncbi:protein-L-isoaspartate(D-aspartate) O-methyltransferase [Nitrosomonas eutropha]|uniref:protein-L-isoaspartate(D-aspartate) O-methyltransferase n=1 Tax=Nitrosomonas eutropha TaxID=916 RepID=UPI0008834D70|nr:protein-L-isoaspartate(D-aspartate) O-methyltransferase [Nitrosomonas eutropha]SCX28427.1 protein-L-isoaspartate(D-aspartate) O-methyltransferase [Nitrosomonas eutropha]
MSVRHSGIGMTSPRTRVRMVERLREQGVRDEVVLAAMGSIPRHLFVEEALASRAYEDVALPINYGQTISSPWIVGRMSELLRNGGNNSLRKVLEIGTGCGYQTAVLAKMANEVYSIERIGPLLTRTRIRLRELGIRNIYLKHADGMRGLLEAGPFDGIMMTAVIPEIPETLLEQLAMGGRMVFPKGNRQQYLCVIDHTTEGFVETILDEVMFVPILPGTINR